MAQWLVGLSLPSERGFEKRFFVFAGATVFLFSHLCHLPFENMGIKGLLIIFFLILALASGQGLPRDTILNALSSSPQLSDLSHLVNSLPFVVQQFNSADNFTFLAPTNDAVSSWLATNRSSDDIQATLQYHLLNGTFPSVSIPSTPIFIPTALTNQSYCNVTGGQRVKAWNNGHLLFGSALQTTSNAITTVIITTSLQALRSFD